MGNGSWLTSSKQMGTSVPQGSEFCTLDETSAPTTPQSQPCETLSREDPGTELLTYRNCDVVTGCGLKLLNLGDLLFSSRKPIH